MSPGGLAAKPGHGRRVWVLHNRTDQPMDVNTPASMPRPGPLTVYTSNDGKGRAVEGTDFKMRLEGHRHAVGIEAAN